MAIRLSLTIPEEQQEFLNANPTLSPSKILQQSLTQMIRNYHLGENMDKDFIEELRKGRENWQKLFYKAQEFITKKGFEIEFSEELMK